MSKELRKTAGVAAEDRLIIKPLSSGRILLEKTTPQTRPDKDSLDWLLSHPARIRSKRIKLEVKKRNTTRELLDERKEQLWISG